MEDPRELSNKELEIALNLRAVISELLFEKTKLYKYVLTRIRSAKIWNQKNVDILTLYLENPSDKNLEILAFELTPNSVEPIEEEFKDKTLVYFANNSFKIKNLDECNDALEKIDTYQKELELFHNENLENIKKISLEVKNNEIEKGLLEFEIKARNSKINGNNQKKVEVKNKIKPIEIKKGDLVEKCGEIAAEIGLKIGEKLPGAKIKIVFDKLIELGITSTIGSVGSTLRELGYRKKK